MEKFLAINQPEPSHTASPLHNQWHAPVGYFIKVNFDAALFEDLNCLGVGWYWGSTGAFLTEFSAKVPSLLDAQMAEAFAAG